jgi:pimeloyl-ACP methyl ester carboxylesterase
MAPAPLRSLQHFVPNRDGWHLSAQQTWDPERLDPGSRPVLIVPGYGMNSFAFGYHPRGVSFEGTLAAAGLEVWRVDLRGQGDSTPVGGAKADAPFGLEDLATTDLAAVIDAVLERTRTSARSVSVIGASLGGTIAFSHLALTPNHRVAALVAMGSPVRWVRVHPLIRFAFGSPALAGLVRFRGTRALARAALPQVLEHVPWVLSLYITPGQFDHGAVSELVRTVEDPSRSINRQIAHWIRERDLVLRGVNVAEALRGVTTPLLCVLANGDGIVPAETARFCYEQVGSSDRELLVVGDRSLELAHADLFVSDDAEARVFAPVRDWLLARGADSAPSAAT